MARTPRDMKTLKAELKIAKAAYAEAKKMFSDLNKTIIADATDPDYIKTLRGAFGDTIVTAKKVTKLLEAIEAAE